MLPGQNHEEVFLDAKMLNSASDCRLNNLSSPSSSGLCAVSHEGSCTTSFNSSSDFLCNDRNPGSDLAVSTLQHAARSYIPPKSENGYDDATVVLCLKGSVSSGTVSTHGTEPKHESSSDFDDELSNIVLSERRKMLLSRRLAKSQKPFIQENLRSKALPSNTRVKVEPFLSDEFDDKGNYVMKNSSGSVTSVKIELGVIEGAAEDDCGHLPLSSLPSAIPVKLETVLSNEMDNEEKTYQAKSSSPTLLTVKTEGTFSMEASEDELDHMPLLDRLMLLSTETSPSSKFTKNLRCPWRSKTSRPGLGRGVLESDESITVTRPRKKKRTATNSAETALEEDAPGLLKVLIDKGVSAEDIKLYGEPESDEAIDESFCEDSFAELEAVMWKLFSHRESLLKVTPTSYSKGSKLTYCLGCLFSLVEQARYLKSQNWPVEWGWSRDLQAFIFVFERHNRIVLERPEYGYATYFFEMLDSVPVSWQIRRLVIGLKLTGCGRISLLENRPLRVGDDLSEGEARVLSQYGWVPNTGLATMLNYCGRVVHDTNNERDGNEWKLKIGRMLVDGYNGGSLMPRFLVKKTVEDENTQVKLEI